MKKIIAMKTICRMNKLLILIFIKAMVIGAILHIGLIYFIYDLVQMKKPERLLQYFAEEGLCKPLNEEYRGKYL